MLADASGCLALGVLLAGALLALRAALGESRAARALRDLAGAVLAAAGLCSFAASRSAAGAVRWYMLAALAAGLWAGQTALGPAVRRAAALARWAAAAPLRLVFHRALAPAAGRLGAATGRKWRKIRLRSQKRRKKRLQKNAGVLYNSN